MSFLTIVPIVQGHEAHTASGKFQCAPVFKLGLLLKDRQRRLEQHSPVIAGRRSSHHELFGPGQALNTDAR